MRRIDAAHPAGRFLLQAAIASVHADAATWEATDWPAVLGLYDRLGERWPSPVVSVNRAVALSFVAGPAAGLEALDALAEQPSLRSWHYLPAARADLLRRLNRDAEAAAAYREAIALAPAGTERDFLQRRCADLDVGDDGTP
jgi:RNA polymerase sigma-70 factor (ECF subfamily)